jgi:hypothetical protein
LTSFRDGFAATVALTVRSQSAAGYVVPMNVAALKGNVLRSQPKYELFADMGGIDLGMRTDAKSVKRTAIAEAFPAVGHKMLFLFDYGDEWRFVVEFIEGGQKDPKARYPKVLKKVGEAPPQYRWDEEDDE